MVKRFLEAIVIFFTAAENDLSFQGKYQGERFIFESFPHRIYYSGASGTNTRENDSFRVCPFSRNTFLGR